MDSHKIYINARMGIDDIFALPLLHNILDQKKIFFARGGGEK